MAETRGAWGIDIGQAGLKAMRIRYADAAGQAIAVAFDYVPHPKILSQPDAVPEELIPQALEKFLSRNDVAGDAVAISVPGHSALARFIQLPPVEASKVAEIVKYEARQQIPFALEDVIWDYQTLGSGVEESGYLLEAEVGLFAMKRDQVLQQLHPFNQAKVEVDLIQIAPLALYNVLAYDVLGMRPGAEFNAGDEYTIMLDMGADNTTLLVSNGAKIWIRNVPIGGNHFTRALTKEMKLTFAKAEHLKCNATKSPDPRAVFQALRPVFNDYVSEIQRSIGYFSSVNRDAKIVKVLGAGNGFKLAGLQKFLQQNLQYEVERLENFQALVGDAVLGAPLFQDNVLTFTVPYGLALQALNLTRIHTTLLPPEIATARKIRRKKPWAVMTAATLLLGLSLSAAGYANAWRSLTPERWDESTKKVENLRSERNNLNNSYSAAESDNASIKDKGNKLIGNLEERDYWLEVYKAINACLPRDTDPDETDIRKRNRVKLHSITTERYADLKAWFDGLPDSHRIWLAPHDKETPPSGPGYVFTLEGLHYHYDEQNAALRGINYVKETLVNNLQQWAVQHEDAVPVPVGKIGISHATIVFGPKPREIEYYPSGKRPLSLAGAGGRQGFRGVGAGANAPPGLPDYTQPDYTQPTPGVGVGRRPPLPNLPVPSEEAPKVEKILQQDFRVQFVWKATPKAERKDHPPWAPAPAESAPPADAAPQQPPADQPEVTQ